jgi:hypothetical protein
VTPGSFTGLVEAYNKKKASEWSSFTLETVLIQTKSASMAGLLEKIALGNALIEALGGQISTFRLMTHVVANLYLNGLRLAQTIQIIATHGRCGVLMKTEA